MRAHPDLTALFGPDPGARGRRAELLEHVRACAACRAEIAAVDPSRLFALLATAPVPLDALERLSARLSADVATGLGSAGTLPALPHRRWPAAASVAASLVLAAILGTYLIRGSRDGAGETATGLERVIVAAPGSPVPVGEVELLAPREAELVSFTVGETKVVMIFNEALDL